MTLKSAHCLLSFSNFSKTPALNKCPVQISLFTSHTAALVYAIFGGVSLAVFFIGAENHVWQNVFIGNQSP